MRIAVAGGTGVVGRKGLILPVPVPVPGGFGRAMGDGTLVPGPGSDHGTQTYAAWLRSRR
jgi:hypothetical protein